MTWVTRSCAEPSPVANSLSYTSSQSLDISSTSSPLAFSTRSSATDDISTAMRLARSISRSMSSALPYTSRTTPSAIMTPLAVQYFSTVTSSCETRCSLAASDFLLRSSRIL